MSAAHHTPRHNLPFILGGQAQKHITHNEAILEIDARLQLAVEGTVATPPPDPADGDTWIVHVSPQGGFSGHGGQLAQHWEGVWRFRDAQTGWLAWNRETDELLVKSDDGWLPVTALPGSSESLGINTDADTQNRLAVRSAAALFTHEGSDHRIAINKAEVTDTASLVFQSDFSGRAEFGLAGEDAFSVKVSPDGSAWQTALVIGPDTAVADAPNGLTRGGNTVWDAGNLPNPLAFQGFIGGEADLDNYGSSGVWHQNTNAAAGNGVNYPAPYAGLLHVTAAGNMVYQTYRIYSNASSGFGDAMFTRGSYYGNWSAWKRVATM